MAKRKLIHLDFTRPKGGPKSEVVFGEEEIRLTEHLSATLSLAQVAGFFGISERTFHNIRAKQPEVDQAYHRGRAKAVNSVGRSLISLALSGDQKAMQFFLATQGGWKKTEAVEHTSPDGSMSPQSEVDYSKLSTEALKEIRDAAKPRSSGD